MTSTASRWFWIIGICVILLLGIPWFLWGVDHIVVGLPLWLWWHIIWLAVAAIFFWQFAKRAWGLGITDGEPS